MSKVCKNPYAYVWSIQKEKINDLLLNNSNGQLLHSSTFGTDGYKYAFQLYQNGVAGNENEKTVDLMVKLDELVYDFVSLFFGCIIVVESASYKKHFTCVFSEYQKECNFKLFSPADLMDPANTFIENDKLILKIKGYTMDIDKKISPPVWSGTYNFGQTCSDDKFVHLSNPTDLTLVAAQNEIQVHKFVLKMQSDVFDEKIEKMYETGENRITVPYFFDLDTTLAAIKLMYNCEMEMTMSERTMFDIWKFFNHYKVHDCKTKMEQIIIDLITPFNASDILSSARNSGANHVYDKCLDFFSEAIESQTTVQYMTVLWKEDAVKLFQKRLCRDLDTVNI